MKTVEIRIKDGDKTIRSDSFKLGDTFSVDLGAQYEPLNKPEYTHDDEWVMNGYEFKPRIINLKPAPPKVSNVGGDKA